MKLHMDESEILLDYKDAKNKFQQVGILAELNCCSKKEMAQWLKDHDQDVDKRFFAAGRSKWVRETEPTETGTNIPEPAEIPPAPEPKQSAKDDAGKPRLTLVPMQIIFDIAEVREYGNKKYKDPDNWKQVEAERHFEAFLRHVAKAWYGDHLQIDPESGLLHLSHAACDLSFFLALTKEAERNDTENN